VTLEHVVRRAGAPCGADRPPLAVLLHGLGADEQDLFGLAPFLDPRLVVVSVRAPHEAQPMGYSWFDIDWSESPPRLDFQQVVGSRSAILRFVGEAAEAHGADPSRVWLVGFSQGASMATACALARPEMLRGIVAHSGRVTRRAVPALPVPGLAGFPVLWQHGRADPVVPVSFGHEARDLLGSLGLRVDYREYPIGHEVSEESLRDLAGWLTRRVDEALAG
jgi:phospholipase/carboxylesterase